MKERCLDLVSAAQADSQFWVVFTNQTELPWIRVLKTGFRHCFVLINDGEHWISIDPMANYMDVLVHDVPSGFNLPHWLEARDHQVMAVHVPRKIHRVAPCMVFTCVEACKRILGIHKRFIFTPWQLYRYLENYKETGVI